LVTVNTMWSIKASICVTFFSTFVFFPLQRQRTRRQLVMPNLITFYSRLIAILVWWTYSKKLDYNQLDLIRSKMNFWCKAFLFATKSKQTKYFDSKLCLFIPVHWVALCNSFVVTCQQIQFCVWLAYKNFIANV